MLVLSALHRTPTIQRDGTVLTFDLLILEMESILRWTKGPLGPVVSEILSSQVEKNQILAFRKILEGAKRSVQEKGVPLNLPSSSSFVCLTSIANRKHDRHTRYLLASRTPKYLLCVPDQMSRTASITESQFIIVKSFSYGIDWPYLVERACTLISSVNTLECRVVGVWGRT